MLMSLNGKVPRLFPFQRGEGGSIPPISIQGSSTFNNNQRKEEALLTRVSSISLDTSTQEWVLFCLEVISYARFEVQWISTAYCRIKL